MKFNNELHVRILRWRSRGWTIAAIAAKVRVNPRTVTNHLRRAEQTCTRPR